MTRSITLVWEIDAGSCTKHNHCWNKHENKKSTLTLLCSKLFASFPSTVPILNYNQQLKKTDTKAAPPLTNLRVVRALQALLVSWRRALLPSGVTGVLGHTLSLRTVHASHRGGSGAHHPGGGHAWWATGSRVGHELSVVRGSTTHLQGQKKKEE